MIQTRNLSYHHASGKGIFNLNIEIPRGESCALIGPSGCGKTTLIHSLTGLYPPQKGEIVMGGSGKTCRIGLVQQKDSLFPWLTCKENIILGFSDRSTPGDKQHQDVHELLEALGITGTEGRYPARMSGGQRQRASIARALIGKPDILLMDEPSAALDTFSKESLQDLLLGLLEGSEVTTLFVTHSIEEALFLGQTVLIMKEGQIFSTYKNPIYPDPEARNHKDFYAEVIKLRQTLKEASL